MFCPKCGNQLPDNSQYCNYCGSQIVTYARTPDAPVAATQTIGSDDYAMHSNTAPLPLVEAAPAAYAQDASAAPPATYAPHSSTQAVPMAPVAPVKSKKKKGCLPAALLLVALLALTLFAFPSIRNFLGVYDTSSPTGAVEKAASAAIDLNFDRMLDTVPPDLLDYGLSFSGYSSKQELISYLNESVENLDAQTQGFGFDLRSLTQLAQVKTSNVSYYSEDGLATLRNEWNNRIPGFGDTFQNAATVTVDISGNIELFGQKIPLSTYLGSAQQHVTTVQIDGQWYLLESDLSELMNLL